MVKCDKECVSTRNMFPGQGHVLTQSSIKSIYAFYE